MTICLDVNGETHELVLSPMKSLLSVLREHLGLTGAKEACGRGECGSCTVLIRGKPVLACVTLVGRASGEILTIEGLGPEWDDLRQSFADHGGFQCGYCTPGQIMRTVALLNTDIPTDHTEARRTIRYQMSGNVCRCTGYDGIVDAIMQFLENRGKLGDAKRLDEAAP